jgi:hypothetical protein
MDGSGRSLSEGVDLQGRTSTPRHPPPVASRPLDESGGLEVPSSNLGAPIMRNMLQKLMFWRKHGDAKAATPLPNSRPNEESQPRKLSDLNPDDPLEIQGPETPAGEGIPRGAPARAPRGARTAW